LPVEFFGSICTWLDCAERTQLGEREIYGEPARHRHAVDDERSLSVSELCATRDVCGRSDLGLVTCHEVSITGRDEIGFDEVRTHFDGESIRLERVLGAVARRSAMGDDERSRRAIHGVASCVESTT